MADRCAISFVKSCWSKLYLRGTLWNCSSRFSRSLRVLHESAHVQASRNFLLTPQTSLTTLQQLYCLLMYRRRRRQMVRGPERYPYSIRHQRHFPTLGPRGRETAFQRVFWSIRYVHSRTWWNLKLLLLSSHSNSIKRKRGICRNKSEEKESIGRLGPKKGHTLGYSVRSCWR